MAPQVPLSPFFLTSTYLPHCFPPCLQTSTGAAFYRRRMILTDGNGGLSRGRPNGEAG